MWAIKQTVYNKNKKFQNFTYFKQETNFHQNNINSLLFKTFADLQSSKSFVPRLEHSVDI